MPLVALIGLGLLLLAAGFLLGRIGRGPAAADREEISLLRRQGRELSRDLESAKDELARKKELSTRFPALVRRLSENLPPDAIPGIGVRFLKDFFHASCVGYFAPVAPGTEFTLIEGVGFPKDWKGSIRLPSDRGMLGMAMRHNTAVSRQEYLARLGTQEIGSSPLEQTVGVADLIVPVPAATGTLGAIVLAGCGSGTIDERSFASMLADLLGSALDRASAMVSAELEASADMLTGLSNRRHFSKWFEGEVRQAKNYGHLLSLFLFDIDHFKRINDTYGHPAGDQILKALAVAVRRVTRSSDLVARYGGEEFAVVMVSSSREQAMAYADGVRGTIASLEIRVPGETEPLRITVSGGIATYPADGETTTDLIRAADEALYAAKQEGRNRVCAARRLGIDGKPV